MHHDQQALGQGVKEDAVAAHAPAPGRRLPVEPSDVAAEGIRFHP